MSQALLVMDMQSYIVESMKNSEHLLSKTAEAISIARKNSIPVIYVMVKFREGFPEISANNKTFAALKANKLLPVAGTDIHPLLKPEENDVVIIKKRFSAFAGSDLEVVLRSMNADHITLAGISTSGVMLSTVREAADKDYRITVLAECCADRDEEVHHFLISKIFPRQADVLSNDAWLLA